MVRLVGENSADTPKPCNRHRECVQAVIETAGLVLSITIYLFGYAYLLRKTVLESKLCLGVLVLTSGLGVGEVSRTVHWVGPCMSR
jgi:hypothetical protein